MAASSAASDQLVERIAGLGIALNSRWVDDREALRAALRAGAWHFVIATTDVAKLSPFLVLTEVQLSAAGVPVIVVDTAQPPALDSQNARALFQAGARDVILAGPTDALALAVERVQMRKAAGPAEAATASSALAAFAAAVRRTTSRASLLAVILEQVRQLLQVAGAAVMTSSQAGELLVEAAHNWWYPTGVRLPAGQGLAHRALEVGEVVEGSLDPVPAEGGAAAPAQAPRVGACVPLVALGQVIGVLGVAAEAPLHPGQAQQLSALADMVASAVHRATLHEQTEQRLRRLAALHAVDIAITTSFDLRVTLSIVLDHLASQVRIDAAAVLLLNAPSQTLEYVAVRGLRPGLLRQPPLRLSTTPASRVIVQRQPVQISRLPEAIPGLPAALAGFNAYYGVPLIAKGRVQGVLELLNQEPIVLDADAVDFVNSLATQTAIAIDNATLFTELQRTNVELNLAYDATIEGWARVLEARGIESSGHTRRVADLTVQVARAAGFSESELIHVRRGALLHDIGMLGVPENVLLSPGPLSPTDSSTVQKHPEIGFEILAPIHHLRQATDITYCHHERWDGGGYPRGLRGESIPMAARLFAVVDVWDALCSDRPFRRAWPEARVREYLSRQSGTQFEPVAVNTFLRTMNGHGSH